VVSEITPLELRRRLDAGEALTVLDVREPWECAIARLAASINIPLDELPQRLGELDAHATTIVMCKSGGRSRRAAQFLAGAGFEQAINLAGGIDAWARDVDPGLPTY
jgi:sulfur-carrier protein adenylyltransferase/sulfurtransferase